MLRFLIYFFAFAFLCSSPAYAVMEDYPSVKLQGLDKSVGRTVTFEAKVGDTIQYGPLFIKIHACRKAPLIEKPESAAFLQIWEVPPGEKKSAWAFSGWMFASSPALSAMDHPVYDVWVLDCFGREEPVDENELDATQVEGETEQTATPTDAENTVPVDMEAEPDSEPVTEPQGQVLPDTQISPEIPAMTEGQPQPSFEQAPEVSDPSLDKGVTAYDFMKQQQGTNAAPAPAPAQNSPIY